MMEEYRRFLKGRSVLITGGTGSFGGMMLETLINTEVERITIFSRDEKKQEELRFKFSDPRIFYYVGDVRDRDSVDRAVRGSEFVFHAAALKQVPSCEFNPLEAVYTNILGAKNVLDSAIERECKSVVVLSTDKAVYPINAMGISKSMMEKIAISRARECMGAGLETKINITRYGNVMGSRGSVIPLFVSQIKQGSPLTVTVPEMTRFMMSLEESVDLVLYAFFGANQGDTVVRKSPGATVMSIAKALAHIFEVDVPINVVGARHGEKMHESLCSAEEFVLARDCGGYFEVPADLRPLTTYSDVGGSPIVDIEQSYTSENTHRLEFKDLVALLLSQECVKEALG